MVRRGCKRSFGSMAQVSPKTLLHHPKPCFALVQPGPMQEASRSISYFRPPFHALWSAKRDELVLFKAQLGEPFLRTLIIFFFSFFTQSNHLCSSSLECPALCFANHFSGAFCLLSGNTPCISEHCPADDVWRLVQGSISRHSLLAYCEGVFADTGCWTRLRNTWSPAPSPSHLFAAQIINFIFHRKHNWGIQKSLSKEIQNVRESKFDRNFMKT